MAKYMVLNFAYGTGPYVMTTKLGIAVNDELEKAGQPRLGIIVPWVYGEKQKEIMAEEGLLSEEVVLDPELGAILKKVFYGGADYAAYLKKWTTDFKEVSREAHAYLSKQYGSKIVLEVNRSPRLLYGVAPAYATSFGHLSRIFGEAVNHPEITIDPELLKRAAEVSACIEDEQDVIGMAYPGVFFWAKDYKPEYKSERVVPPIAPIPHPDTNDIEKGIFITKTGIPGLERLYGEAEKLGLKIYDNSSYSPAMITNKNILLHFARSGWASVWFSMLAEKPLIVPEYDPKDDLEIFFNNMVIEKLGIGIVYRGEPLNELLEKSEKAKEVCQQLKKEITECWGTLDGTQYSAGLFVRDFLRQL